MRTKIYNINDKNLYKFSLLHHENSGVSNEQSRNKMKRLLARAIRDELTELQRVCITEHYLKRKKQKDIALELGLSTSTVCRHIKAAEKKLKHIASYYES